MRTCLIITLIALAPILSLNAEETADDSSEVSASTAFSQAMGQLFAHQISSLGLDAEEVISAMRAGGQPPPQERLQQLYTAHMAHIEQERAAAGPQWKQDQGLPEAVHDEFYRAFIKMDGVTVTDSGLAYQILSSGDGQRPSASDTVMVHYDGRHTSGVVFCSSRERGTPMSFDLSGDLIQGWKEAIPLLPVGTEVRLVIPAELAYGPHNPHAQHPTGILIFDIEIKHIIDKP